MTTDGNVQQTQFHSSFSLVIYLQKLKEKYLESKIMKQYEMQWYFLEELYTATTSMLHPADNQKERDLIKEYDDLYNESEAVFKAYIRRDKKNPFTYTSLQKWQHLYNKLNILQQLTGFGVEKKERRRRGAL